MTNTILPGNQPCDRQFDEQTRQRLASAPHYEERELEALCFGIPRRAYNDLCVPDAERDEFRKAIRQSIENGSLIAEPTGTGNALYGGEWRVERVSAIRWAMGRYQDFPRWLASQAVKEIIARQDVERRAAGRYTLQEAADELARNSGERADDIVQKLKLAVAEKKLPVHRPGERLDYQPTKVREYYDEVYWDDLNAWLEDNAKRIVWRFPVPAQATKQADAGPTDDAATTNDGEPKGDDADDATDDTGLTPAQRREKLDITLERGCRRRILEKWSDIESEYGPRPDGRQVRCVLARDKSESPPNLKTVQNRLIELRNEKLIP